MNTSGPTRHAGRVRHRSRAARFDRHQHDVAVICCFHSRFCSRGLLRRRSRSLRGRPRSLVGARCLSPSHGITPPPTLWSTLYDAIYGERTGKPRPGPRHRAVSPRTHHCRSRCPSRRRSRGRWHAQGAGGRAGEVQGQQGHPQPAGLRGPGAAPPPPAAGPPTLGRCPARHRPAALGRARPAAPAS
jgi:hypothetical protein